MSTKTLRKRVALATVVALGAGVLSLVSTTAANAAASTTAGINSTAGTTSNNQTTTGYMYVATVANVSGVAATNASVGSNKSLGLLSVGDIAGNAAPVAGTTQTATLLSSGKLVLFTYLASLGSANADNQVAAFTVTGGTLADAVGNGSPVYSYNAGNTAVGLTTGTGGLFAVSVTPNTGATSMTINMYTGQGYDTSGTWGKASGQATADAAVASPTTGTLKGSITVTIAGTSTSGTVSASKSGVYYSSDGGLVTSDTSTKISNQPAVATAAYNVVQYATVVIKDAYGSAVSSGGLIQVSATNGALVKLGTGGSSNTSTPTATSDYGSTNGTATQWGITVLPAVLTASSTVVSVTLNGTLIGTKAFTFNGKVAKVVLGTAGNGKVGGTGFGNLIPISFQDSAGTTLYVGSTGLTSSYSSSVTKNADTAGTGIALSTVTLPGSSTAYSSAGYVAFTCGVAATGQIKVDYTNLDGTVVSSNAAPVSCSGTADTYTAKLDKSSYKPGDIATLTVTFKDSNGAIAADEYTLANGTYGSITADSSAISSAAKVPNILGSNLTNTAGTSTTAGSALDVTTNGVATYKFVVGSTDGSYQLVVDFGKVDANGHGASLLVPYTIASGSTSLNDVLKGIVSLIASINKQIAALAKLVTKKK